MVKTMFTVLWRKNNEQDSLLVCIQEKRLPVVRQKMDMDKGKTFFAKKEW